VSQPARRAALAAPAPTVLARCAAALGLTLLLAAPVAADPARAPGSPLARGIAEMASMPGGPWRAVRVEGSDALYFISGNGRWVVKGEAYDLWAGAALPDFEAVRASTRTVAFAGLGDLWPGLAPVTFGTGETDIIVFADPRCPHCEALIRDLQPFADRYRILVLQIPLLGEESGRIVRAVHCAADRDAARAAVLAGPRAAALAPATSCDLGPLQRRLVTAELIGVRGVPFMVHGQTGRFVEGRPDDLAAWLGGRS
jgi:thiol:disulfide interchange protein DsbC